MTHLQPNNKHEQARHIHTNSSRVRVDANGLEMADCISSCLITKYPGRARNTASAARQVRHGGLEEAGKPGYITPACFNKSTRCAVAQSIVP